MSESSGVTLAVLGCGTMASAILAGLLDADVVRPDGVVATAASQASRERIRSQLGVRVCDDNAAACAGAKVVLLGVKPHLALPVLREARLGPDTVLVSIAAGVPTTALHQARQAGPVVRVMPNTPASVGRGVFIVSPARGAEQAGDEVAATLERVGDVVQVPEHLHDAATAVSGSGPAYIFLVAEAMMDAAVGLGVPRAQASELVIGTLSGSAELLRQGQHPAALRNQVTSPGGTTAAALDELEAHGLRTAFSRAMKACCDKARSMGDRFE